MICRTTIGIFMAVCVLLVTRPAAPSGGAITGIGGFAKSESHDTGSREWIDLKGSEGLLSGQPQQGEIRLISIYAPGVEQGHLILRELKSTDGGRSFLLTAPDYIAAKVRRATIYLDHPRSTFLLVQQKEDRWLVYRPQVLRTSLNVKGEDLALDLVAYSTEGIGFYWLVRDDSVSPLLRTFPTEPSARKLLGGSTFRSLLPIISAILVLVVGWTISRWAYRGDQKCR